jgi:hypothetical protein
MPGQKRSPQLRTGVIKSYGQVKTAELHSVDSFWLSQKGVSVYTYRTEQSDPSSSQRGGSISKQVSGLGKNKLCSWVPMGPETKNDCTGEGKRQITVPLCRLATVFAPARYNTRRSTVW